MFSPSRPGPGSSLDAIEIERLYESHWGDVVRVVMSVLGPRLAADAQDVAQEVFLEGFSRIGSLRDREAFGGWIRRIAWRRAIDRTRLARHRMPHGPLDLSDPSLITADDELERLDRSTTVETALERLPEKQRAALRMFYWLGMGISEIAVALGTAGGTVKSLLSRGRRNVGKTIARMEQTDERM